MHLDIDRVTALALAEFERTDVGITIGSWMQTLIEERKERLSRHRGITSIPDMWHDQGFIDGVRAVAYLFQHAGQMAAEEEVEDELEIPVPEPSYLGANPEQPRR
jgi:hypothetical protein